MSHDTHPAAGSHGSRRTYLIGFALSAALTAIPFWLVMTGVLVDAQATALAIIALAFVQIVVHTTCFLHVNSRSEGGWTMIALIFTIVIVAIVISGSMWIMFHLNGNMMPMTGAGMTEMP
ncbi:cytochrome o ubiquinol oxidase subunit IV [Microvirga sp. SRT01]|jgi:cytochrome o ubiquinol oxidase operon protein cyoD|uniref:Cytochrome bo(3) ubiquinol oxidase subunit 4 n=1 Tax=Sphingomonas longa TaxID=2778730 RepID=A0ABS2D534_9SPHN|nr:MULTISPECIES: cytochrome o ubiquinol oxidase subunit IV [Alphaproteobacteria]MBM6576027.1 cytochrome o ubiquinol oxidase subunit IV [Sphingomonas sp. BT552]MBR7709073.1 cytochrome o ubiquinol oxidase subunit IV [Microvirga sp. SRT01]